MAKTLIKTDWVVTAQQVYDNNNLAVNYKGISICNVNNVETIYMYKYTDNGVEKLRVRTNLRTSDFTLLASDVTPELMLKKLKTLGKLEGLKELLDDLFIKNISSLRDYFDKKISAKDMQLILDSITGLDSMNSIDGIPTVDIELTKVNTSPFENSLSQAISINIIEPKSTDRKYIVYSINDKIYVASKIISKDVCVKDITIFDTLKELLDSRYLNEVPKFDKEIFEKLFNNCMQIPDKMMDEFQPATAWIKNKIVDCDENSSNYILKLRLLDFINTIVGSKKYEYTVTLGYARSTESSANAELPQRRGIMIKVKEAYNTKRANLDKQYSVFNDNDIFATYSIYKTELNAENEVTIVGTRIISSNLSWDSAIFYSLDTMSVSKGKDYSNIVMPIIMDMLPTLFANKSNVISYLTDGSKRAELQTIVSMTNSNQGWVN